MRLSHFALPRLGATLLALAPAFFFACSDEPTQGPLDASAGRDGSAPDSAVPVPPRDARADGSDADRDPCVEMAPPLCSPTRTFGAGVPVAGVAGRFASVTPNELHIAVFDADDAGTTLRVADRTSAVDAFPTGIAVPFPIDSTGASLSSNGLELFVTQASNARRLPRGGAGQAFGVPTGDGFNFGSEGQQFRGPVALDNGGFFLTRVGVGPGQLGFTEIAKKASGYEQAVVVLQAELLNTSADGTKVRAPTGMSKDLRTLFFYDEESKASKMAHRPAVDCPYTTFVSIGDRPGAQPNATCSALYYADPTTGAAMRAELSP